MKRIEYPIVDIRPGDRFERYRSQRTGYVLVYQYRRVHGTGYDSSTLVASFGSQAEATTCRNHYRRQEERIRADNDCDERVQHWAGLETTRMEGLHG
jgi:hypothetical protein